MEQLWWRTMWGRSSAWCVGATSKRALIPSPWLGRWNRGGHCSAEKFSKPGHRMGDGQAVLRHHGLSSRRAPWQPPACRPSGRQSSLASLVASERIRLHRRRHSKIPRRPQQQMPPGWRPWWSAGAGTAGASGAG